MKHHLFKYFQFFIVSLLMMLVSINLFAQKNDPEWRLFNTGNSGLPGNLLLSLYIDNHNKIWAGTNQDGVGVFDGNNWINFTTANSGLQDDRITCFTEDKEGVIWIGTDAGGLASFDGSNWEYFTTGNSGIPHNWVTDIVVDEANNKYIGTDGGLVRYDGSEWVNLTAGLSYSSVAGLALEGDSVLWVCTGWGFNRYNFQQWTKFYEVGGMPSPNFWKVTVDQATGIKWITTQYGLLKYDNVEFYLYTTLNSSLPHDYVMSVELDAAGKKWIATWGGVAVFDDVNWTLYNTGNSLLPTNTARQVRIDTYGNKWIATDGGLVEFNETGILAVNELSDDDNGCLGHNYPNPVSGMTLIPVWVPYRGPVSLKILSLEGREIAVLADEVMEAGEYEIVWNAAGIPAGIYIARLRWGGVIFTRKIEMASQIRY